MTNFELDQMKSEARSIVSLLRQASDRIKQLDWRVRNAGHIRMANEFHTAVDRPVALAMGRVKSMVSKVELLSDAVRRRWHVMLQDRTLPADVVAKNRAEAVTEWLLDLGGSPQDVVKLPDGGWTYNGVRILVKEVAREA